MSTNTRILLKLTSVLLEYRNLILQICEGFIKNKDDSFKTTYLYGGVNFEYWIDATRKVPKDWFDCSWDNHGVKGKSEFEISTVQMTGSNQFDFAVRATLGKRNVNEHEEQLKCPHLDG